MSSSVHAIYHVQLVGLHYTPLFSMCVGDGGLLQHPTLGVPEAKAVYTRFASL